MPKNLESKKAVNWLSKEGFSLLDSLLVTLPQPQLPVLQTAFYEHLQIMQTSSFCEMIGKNTLYLNFILSLNIKKCWHVALGKDTISYYH